VEFPSAERPVRTVPFPSRFDFGTGRGRKTDSTLSQDPASPREAPFTTAQSEVLERASAGTFFRHLPCRRPSFRAPQGRPSMVARMVCSLSDGYLPKARSFQCSARGLATDLRASPETPCDERTLCIWSEDRGALDHLLSTSQGDRPWQSFFRGTHQIIRNVCPSIRGLANLGAAFVFPGIVPKRRRSHPPPRTSRLFFPRTRSCFCFFLRSRPLLSLGNLFFLGGGAIVLASMASFSTRVLPARALRSFFHSSSKKAADPEDDP